MPLVSVFANRTSRLQTVHFHDGPHKYKCVHAYVFSTVFTCPTGIIVLAKKKKIICMHYYMYRCFEMKAYTCSRLLVVSLTQGNIWPLLLFVCIRLPSHLLLQGTRSVYVWFGDHSWTLKNAYLSTTQKRKKKKWRKASFILMLYLEYWSGNMRNHL